MSTTKKFPFIAFEAGAPKRPLVPFDFPIGKNVYCLIDSGASSSLMSEEFMRHENIKFKKGCRPHTAEGICGKNCLKIIGETKPVPMKIIGISKTFELSFIVMSKEHGLGRPIIGQNLFQEFKVGFGKDGKSVYTIIKS